LTFRNCEAFFQNIILNRRVYAFAVELIARMIGVGESEDKIAEKEVLSGDKMRFFGMSIKKEFFGIIFVGGE